MKIAVCDDNKEWMLEIRKQILEISREEEVICFPEMSLFLMERESNFDLVFLNIDWNGYMNGLQIAKDMYQMKQKTKVVFVSNQADEHVQYIYFEKTHVRGLLLKPVNIDFLRRYLNNIKKELDEEQNKSLIINERGKVVVIPHREILYLESNNHMIEIHGIHKNYKVYEALSELANRLPDAFARCHRSYVVNMEYIRDYNSVQLTLSDHQEIPLGRVYKDEIKERCKTYLK